MHLSVPSAATGGTAGDPVLPEGGTDEAEGLHPTRAEAPEETSASGLGEGAAERGGLNSYEKARLERIRRNDEMLAELGVTSAAQELGGAAGGEVEGFKSGSEYEESDIGGDSSEWEEEGAAQARIRAEKKAERERARAEAREVSQQSPSQPQREPLHQPQAQLGIQTRGYHLVQKLQLSLTSSLIEP